MLLLLLLACLGVYGSPQYPMIIKWLHHPITNSTHYQPTQLTLHQVRLLNQHPAIDYIVANGRVVHDAVLGSSKAIQARPPSWGLARIAHRSWSPPTNLQQLVYTFPPQSGSGVDVYVFDSGIDWTHPDLAGRVMSHINFVEHEDNRDTNGHGTHISGTIAGTLYGVAKQARLHAYKVLNKDGEGDAATVIKALVHLIGKRKQMPLPRPLCIANLSLHTSKNRALDQVIDEAIQVGIVIISSSANEQLDTCALSPGGHPGVLAVGSTTSMDTVMETSGTGPCVRLFAPGQDIVSTWPNSQVNVLSGTSMAAPHVSGVAALFLSQHPYTHPTHLIQSILNSSTKQTLTLLDPNTPNRLTYNEL